MQKFFMIIGKNKLNVYSTNGGQWEKQYFEGNPEFEYEVNNARHDIEKMFELLVSEYNLDSKAELEFSVGTIKTGKSTLINALLGHNYASMKN